MQTPAVNPSEALSKLRQSGEPITGETFAKAAHVLEILQALKAPSPFIFPTDVGGIQFEWHGEWRELDIEVLPDRPELVFLTFQYGDFVRESEAEATKENLLAILRWIS
jgi:hypothetical protein